MKIEPIDCLKGLKKLKANSIDLVFFDPPYNCKKDYGIYDDNMPKDKYITWMKNVIDESNRISKRGIGIYIDFRRFKQFYQQIFPECEFITMYKRSPGFATQQNILPCSHYILTNVKAIKNIRSLWDDISPISDGYYCRDKKYNHPGQTALKPTRRFIQYFSKENEIVLDPFLGTGTTALACKQLNRKFIGFELNLDYIKIAKKRLRQKILI